MDDAAYFYYNTPQCSKISLIDFRSLILDTKHGTVLYDNAAAPENDQRLSKTPDDNVPGDRREVDGAPGKPLGIPFANIR
jgi:hypothetical protein